MKTARQIAVEALCRQEKDNAWSAIVLDSAINKEAKFSSQDKSFASALFYGTLTMRYTLDHIIKPLSNRPLNKLDLTVLNIIRTGIYQILYMDSVPNHAAVSEAVKLAKILKKTSASGFINAVLRGFLRTNKKDACFGDISLDYSCPPELVKSLQADYGNDAALQILKASLEIPPAFIRVNTSKTSITELYGKLVEEGLEPNIVDIIPNCIRLSRSSGLYDMEEYKQGLFHIQDLSSQAAAVSLNAKPGERILDCCAAPGGKTFILAENTLPNGSVLACDLYPARVDEILRRNQRLGLSNIQTQTLDMTEHHKDLGLFDRVLCDAPCSGYGTIRRRPEMKYNPISQQKTLPALQLALLNNAAKYCKNGGILLYSTCTLRKAENENVVSAFLEANPNFSFITTEYSLNNKPENTIFIGEHEADGFFIATMQCNGRN